MPNKNKDTRINPRIDTDVYSFLQDRADAERARLGKKPGYPVPIGGLVSEAVRELVAFREWSNEQFRKMIEGEE